MNLLFELNTSRMDDDDGWMTIARLTLTSTVLNNAKHATEYK